ncbi:MAG: right-handed parallel beta-helix repeat-containing protein, partial [Ferruginibacter sp.]
VDGFYITGGYTINGFNLTINGLLMDSKLGSGLTNNGASPVITNCSFIGNEGEGTGGGICNNNSSPAISNCSFSNNLVYLSGTGISNNSSSPTITNCTFSNNIAGTLGAGIYNGGSSPTISNCTFTNNTSNSAGGAIFNTSFQSAPVISKCIFTGNSSYFGGGIEFFNSASGTIKNCSFTNNNSDNDGGGIYGSATSGTINIMNCMFYNNHANITTGSGGAICPINSTNNNSVISCTFYGNTASSGTAMNSTNGILKVHNSVVWGTTTGGSFDFKNSVAEGLAGGTNGNLDGTVITAAQLFANAAGGNLTLNPISPAINAGSNALYTAAGGNLVTDKDVANNARLVNVTVDMGGYEFDVSVLPLKFGTVTAAQDNYDAVINWQTFNEYNISHFEVEFSSDGLNFNKIATVTPLNTTSHTYSYKHLLPAGSQLYYRIKEVDLNGRFIYSATVKVNLNSSTQIKIYPNPASVILQLKNIDAATADFVQIISGDGKILIQQKATTNMQLYVKNIAAGVCILRIVKKDKTEQSFSFIKQ